MDWHSRLVLAWKLSNTMDTDFCVAALEEALSKGRPEIFDTDQGESIDEMLVREGLAEAWTRDGQHRDILVAAEEGARRDRFGCLWRWVVRNSLPSRYFLLQSRRAPMTLAKSRRSIGSTLQEGQIYEVR